MRIWTFVSCLWLALLTAPCAAEETPFAQEWEYAAAMRKASAGWRGREGVVLHVGDSILYANPYGAWARRGEGQSESDKSMLRWAHLGADDDTDGWWLVRFDHPSGGRSHTAAGGMRSDELLAGGKSGLPSLDELLDKYAPRLCVFMIGTNDASAGRSAAEYVDNLRQIVDRIVGRRIVPIACTIPPHIGRPDLAAEYNQVIRDLARGKSLPLIDYEREILHRRARDSDGTLLNRGDVHPTANQGGASPASSPTAENLRNSGYLLLGWLSVKKIAEVKQSVIDATAQ